MPLCMHYKQLRVTFEVPEDAFNRLYADPDGRRRLALALSEVETVINCESEDYQTNEIPVNFEDLVVLPEGGCPQQAALDKVQRVIEHHVILLPQERRMAELSHSIFMFVFGGLWGSHWATAYRAFRWSLGAPDHIPDYLDFRGGLVSREEPEEGQLPATWILDREVIEKGVKAIIDGSATIKGKPPAEGEDSLHSRVTRALTKRGDENPLVDIDCIDCIVQLGLFGDVVYYP